MLKGTCTKLFINDQSYRFPEPGFYFSNKVADLTISGVYGIYLDDELLYVGSSSDMITRQVSRMVADYLFQILTELSTRHC